MPVVRFLPRDVKLIGALGMLGSDHTGERAAAALMVERLRVKLGKQWGGFDPPGRSPEHPWLKLGSLWLRFLTLIQGLWLTAVRLFLGSGNERKSSLLVFLSSPSLLLPLWLRATR